MANFALTASSTFQFVFAGGVYVNVELSVDLIEVESISADENSSLVGRQYYKNLVELATAAGVQIAEANVCYIKDITSDTTQVPNAIVGYSTPPFPYQLEFIHVGTLGVATNVGGILRVPIPSTIIGVTLTRAVAGTSSSTIVDINKGATPVTLYTTQANCPTIAFNDIDSVVVATLPDIVTLAAGDILTMDIDQVEAGTPAFLRCPILLQPIV